MTISRRNLDDYLQSTLEADECACKDIGNFGFEWKGESGKRGYALVRE
jgi:hypothetical protein